MNTAACFRNVCLSYQTGEQIRPAMCFKLLTVRQQSRALFSRRNSSSTQCSALKTIRDEIKKGQSSVLDVTNKYLKEIREKDQDIKSFIAVDEEAARNQAVELDRRIAEEGIDAVGPLAGIPVAVKDNICTRGVQTTAGSRVLSGYAPPYDAAAAARLRSAGAVLIGKTNMDEFGMGSSTENSAFHATRNPHDLSRVPGGSSGGSAAAVAAGLCGAALGSDTGGSIRQPASFCGVVGLKPTYGRVSRHGLIAYASSLDVIGPMATSVRDAALLLSAIAGRDPNDATSADRPSEDFARGLRAVDELASRPLEGRRVGIIRETMGEGVHGGVQAAVQAAAKQLQALGADVGEVSLPSFSLGLPAYYVIAVSEASSNLSRYDGVRYGQRAPLAEGLKDLYKATRRDGLGDEVKRRILMGTYSLSAGYYDAYYKRAQKVRTLVREEMSAALEQYDVLVSPAAPTPAYKIGEKSEDPLAMYKGDLMTVNVNLSGLPACVVPCGEAADGDALLPVGLQMIGRAFGESDLLEVAHTYEVTRF
uniref:Glutamyl-tRNA(Gln) amidotransferase subunit A, chloroplastic/mitochondrial n=1 Tax=Tetraselmis sp. GSL018 TaxID=582737 RepID=A0A061S6J9_9CHLO|mmetsp:Transcript_17931/g.42994  ORF Transcript_17931/g.42994 Transcript_17931/m.42994 type:complete len:535 (-) Transcript_17931:252-1856(-)